MKAVGVDIHKSGHSDERELPSLRPGGRVGSLKRLEPGKPDIPALEAYFLDISNAREKRLRSYGPPQLVSFERESDCGGVEETKDGSIEDYYNSLHTVAKPAEPDCDVETDGFANELKALLLSNSSSGLQDALNIICSSYDQNIVTKGLIYLSSNVSVRPDLFTLHAKDLHKISRQFSIPEQVISGSVEYFTNPDLGDKTKLHLLSAIRYESKRDFGNIALHGFILSLAHSVHIVSEKVGLNIIGFFNTNEAKLRLTEEGTAAIEFLTKYIEENLSKYNGISFCRTDSIKDYGAATKAGKNILGGKIGKFVKSVSREIVTNTQTTRVAQKEVLTDISLNLEQGISRQIGRNRKKNVTIAFIPRVNTNAGDNLKWYRGTEAEVENYLEILAKPREMLLDGDIEYLTRKLSGTHWNWAIGHGDTVSAKIVKIFRIAAEKGQALLPDTIEKLVKCISTVSELADAQDQWFHTSAASLMEELRDDAMRAIDGCVKSGTKLRPAQMKALEGKLSVGELAPLKSKVLRVLSNAGDDSIEIFNNWFDCLKLNEDSLYAMDYLIRQVSMFEVPLKRSGSGFVITDYFTLQHLIDLASILSFSRRIIYEEKVRSDCAVTIGTFFNKLSIERSARGILDGYYAAIEPHIARAISIEASQEVLFRTISIVIAAVENKHILTPATLEATTQKFSTFDRKNQNLTILLFNKISKTPEIFIPLRIDNISVGLSHSEVVVCSATEPISFAVRSEETMENPSISRITAEVILKQSIALDTTTSEAPFYVKTKDLDMATLSNCVELFLSTVEQDAQLLISRVLRYHQLLPQELLDKVFEASINPSKEISTNLRLCFLRSAIAQSTISPSTLSKIVGIYEYDDFFIGAENVAPEINDLVLSNIVKCIQTQTSYGTDLPKEVFDIIDHQICNGEVEDPKLVEIMRLCAQHHIELPQSTVEYLETLFNNETHNLMAQEIIERIVENGQIVSENIVKFYSDKLQVSKILEERDSALCILSSISDNQEISDSYYKIYQLEALGRQLFVFPTQKALEYLRDAIITREFLTPTHFDFIDKNIHNQVILETLEAASKNGQNIPEEIIQKLYTCFCERKANALSTVKIFNAIVQNNQILDDKIISSLSVLAGDPTLREDILTILIKNFSIGKPISKEIFSEVLKECAINPAFCSSHINMLPSLTRVNEIAGTDVPYITAIAKRSIESAVEYQIYHSSSLLLELINRKPELLKSEKHLSLSELASGCLPAGVVFTPIILAKQATRISGANVYSALSSLINFAAKQDSSIELKELVLSIGTIPVIQRCVPLRIKFELLALYKKSDLEIIANIKAYARESLLFEENFAQISSIIKRSPHLYDTIIETLLSLSPENKARVTEDLLDSVTNLLFSTDKRIKIAAVYFISECSQAGKVLTDGVVKSLTSIVSSDAPRAQVEPAISALVLASQNQKLPEEITLAIQIVQEPKLSSAEFDKVLKDLKHRRKISSSTIAKLQRASASPELVRRDLTKLAEIFSILMLRGEVRPKEDITKLLEEAINLGQSGLPLLAYEKILQQGLRSDYTRTIPTIFSCAFGETEDGDFSFIASLKCLQNFVSNYGYKIPDGIVKRLEANLDSDNILLRHLSFKVLRAVQEKDSKYFVPRYEELRYQEESELEALDALDTISLMRDGRDVYSLRELKKFFEKFVCSDRAQRELLGASFKKIEEAINYRKDDPKEIQLLKLLAETVITRGYKLENVTELIALLPPAHDEIIGILSGFEDPILNLKLQRLEYIIASKTSLDPNDVFFELMDDGVRRTSLLSVYGEDKLINLFTKLNSINSFVHYRKVVEFLHTNKDTHKFLDQLRYDSLETCLRELEIATLTDKLHISAAANGHKIDAEKFEKIIRTMVTSLGWEFSNFQPIFSKITQSTVGYVLQALEVINDYEIKSDKLGEITEIISDSNFHEWTVNLNKLAMSCRFAHGKATKNIDQLVSELPESFDPENRLRYRNDVIKIRDKTLHSVVADPILWASISSWGKAEIAEWSRLAKFSKAEAISNIEMLAVLKRANFLHTNFELTDTQILSLLVALDKPEEQGRLLQVATGEGKSTIISILAAIGVIKGRKVDVITSSPVLAKRDADEKAGFYALLGISVGDNSDKSIYVSGYKKCYLKDIVYGDVSQFQFDTLRDEYSGLKTLGERKKELVIVDEVDSMLIDDSSKIAQLSSSMPGMEHLEHIYHLIHNEIIAQIPYLYQPPGTSKLYEMNERVVYGKENNAYVKLAAGIICLNKQFPDGNILEFIGQETTLQEIKTRIQSYIEAKITENAIRVPTHLREFVDYQLTTRWVDAAISAILSFEEEQDYVIGNDERLIRRIKPVDFESTGMVQSSTNWSDGLHQFLQVKHGLCVTPESLTTNFLSNTGYFRRYGNNLYGFTGTLGSDKAKEVLSKTYDIDYVAIPSLREKRYVEFPMHVCDSIEDHDKSIIESSLRESSKGRGVLVICESIGKAKNIARQLQETSLRPRVILYVMNDMDQENAIKSIRPGEIIVATNLAGRGTDIKTTEIEEFGGLHVCLTFLPNNLRVEQQALGRTARQGNLGTAQIICVPDTSDYKLLRKIRDDKEAEILEKFQSQEAEIIKNKDDLFRKFCDLLIVTREEIKRQSSSRVSSVLTEGGSTWEVISKFGGRVFDQAKDGVFQLISGEKPTAYEASNISALEERWGIFFKQLTDSDFSDNRSIEAKFRDFDREVRADISIGKLIRNPYHYITIGNDDIEKEEYARAVEQFDKAISLDPEFAVAAYYGKAVCFIHQKRDKIDVLRELNLSSRLLQSELAILSNMKSLYHEQTATTNQLAERIAVIETFFNNIQTAITVIEKSQRLVDLTLTNPREIQTISKLEKDDAIGKLAHARDSSVEVVFNSLIRWYDCGDKDEAETVLTFAMLIFGKTYTGSVLSIDLDSSLAREILSKDVYFSGCKDAAIEEIKKHKSSSGWLRSFVISSRDLIKLKITSVSYLELPNIDPVLAKKIVESTEEVDGLKFRVKSPGVSEDGEIARLGKAKAIEALSLKRRKVNLEIFTDNNEYLFNFANHAETESAIKAIDGNDTKFELTFVGANTLAKLGAEYSVEFIELTKTKTIEKLEGIKSTADMLDMELCCEDSDDIVKALNEYASFSSEKVQILHDSEWLILTPGDAKDMVLAPDAKKVIKFPKINSNNAVSIARSVSDGMFSIRYDSYNLDKLTQNLGNGSDMKLQIRNINKDSAHNFIDYLRDKKQEFQLGFTGLNSRQAQDLIAKVRDKIKSEEVGVASTFDLEDIVALDKKPREELMLMSKRGVNKLVHLTEKGHVQWRSILAVCGLAALQIGVGIFLMATGIAATAGLGLISEGAVDLYTAYRGYKSRNFSWKGYFYQKLISVAISIASSGYQAIKNAAKKAAAVTENVAQQVGQQFVTEAEEQATQAVIQRTIEKTSGKASSLWVNTGQEAIRALTADVSTKTVVKTVGIRLATMASTSLITSFVNNISKDLKTVIASKLTKKFQDSEILPIIQKLRALQSHENIALRLKEASTDRMIDEIMSEPSEMEAIRKIGGVLSEFVDHADAIFTAICSVAEIAIITDRLFKGLEKKVAAANTNYLGIERLVSIGSKDFLQIDVTEADDIAKKLYRSGVFTPNGCYNRSTSIFTVDKVDLGEHNKFKPSVIGTLKPLCVEETLMETVDALASVAISHITNHIYILMATGTAVGISSLSKKMFEGMEDLTPTERIAADVIMNPVEIDGLYKVERARSENITKTSSADYGVMKPIQAAGGRATDDVPSLLFDGISAEIDQAVKELERRISCASTVNPVIVIGPTGVGKSTLVNFLSGRRLIAEESGSNIIIKAADGGELSLRTSASFISETTIPQQLHDPASKISYWDCPGNWDSRGVKQEIVNSYSIDRIFKIPGHRICIVIPESYTVRSAVGDLKKFVHDLSTLFAKHINSEGILNEAVKGCITTIISNSSYSIAQIQASFVTAASELSLTAAEKAILEVISEKLNLFPRFKPGPIEMEDVRLGIIDKLVSSAPAQVRPNKSISLEARASVEGIFDKKYSDLLYYLKSMKDSIGDIIASKTFELAAIKVIIDSIVEGKSSDKISKEEIFGILSKFFPLTYRRKLEEISYLEEQFNFANSVLEEERYEPAKFLRNLAFGIRGAINAKLRKPSAARSHMIHHEQAANFSGVQLAQNLLSRSISYFSTK